MNKQAKRVVAGILALMLVYLPCTPVVKAEDVDTSTSLEAVPGELLIMYREDAQSQIVLQSDETQAKLRVLSETEDAKIAVVNVSEEVPLEVAIGEYMQQDDIIAVTPNYVLELREEKSMVNDPRLSLQWYQENISTTKGWEYLETRSTEKIRVAVLDTGADIQHEDLSNVVNREYSREILDYTGRMGSLKGDDYVLGKETAQEQRAGHGTHVSGIIAAEANNKVGIAGVGTGGNNALIDLMVVDVMSDVRKTSIAFVIAGLEYAMKQDAKVINLSLGAIKEAGMDDSIYEAVFQKLHKKGITVVCAAGNDGLGDNGVVTEIPGDYASTISVISVDQVNQKAGTSNYGSLKDISAPGENIYSTYIGNDYGHKSGTSMAAPMVTAAVAMMYSLNPDITPEEVRSILKETAMDIGAKGEDIYTGAGLLSVEHALKAIDVKLPFSDVKESDWFYSYVSDMHQRGIMTGLNKTMFGPAEKLARAQFATILYRVAGSTEVTYVGRFPDVVDEQFYSKPAIWGSSKEVGIISGYANGNFGPSDDITREQIATMLFRYATYMKQDVSKRSDINTYPDAQSVTAFAKEPLEWAVGVGIITGDNGRINPQGYANRAECATMMSRYLELH